MKNKVKEVYKLLQQDCIVKIGNGVLWLTDDCQYIMFRSYGQSAVKNTIKDLTWLLVDLLKVTNNMQASVVKSVFA